jgi:hypothetical protein
MRTINRGKKRYKAMAVGALVLSSLLYTATSANAAVWSMIASGCVPEAETAHKVSSSAAFGTVGFREGETETIRFTCPVSGFRDSFGGGPLIVSRMRVTFYDGFGKGERCKIAAALLRSNLDEHEGGLDIADFDSSIHNSEPDPGGTGRRLGTIGIPEVIDLNTSYYLVDLELTRESSSDCNVLGVGVHLD